jgi:hypothetical protein
MAIIRSEPQKTMADVDEREIDRLYDALRQMDGKVVDYIKDPLRHAAPEYERLVARIQAIAERPDHSRVIQLKISNLKHRAYYFEKAWRQIKENAAQAMKAGALPEADVYQRRKETYFCVPDPEKKTEMEKKGLGVSDMLYEMQEMKQKEHGLSQGQAKAESKAQFKHRIADQYQQLKVSGQKDKKIVFIWNRQAQRCDLIVDRRSHASDAAIKDKEPQD